MTRQIRKRQFDGLPALVVRRFRNRCIDRLLRFLTQNAGGRARLVAIDLSTVGIASGNGDAGQLQGARVSHRDVPIHTRQKNRMAAAHLVHIPARGQSLDRPQSFIPAAPHDPVSGGRFFDPGEDAVAKLVQCLYAGQVHVHLLQTCAGQVHVGVIESGHDEVALEIDDLCLRPLQLHDLVALPNGDDTVAEDRQRLRALARTQRRRRIDHSGIDVAVGEDQVRFRLLCGLRGHARGHGQQKNRSDSHHRHYSPTPDRVSMVSRMRLSPRSRPLQSNHSCNVWAPPPEPPPPIAMASRPRDSGMLASVEARCT